MTCTYMYVGSRMNAEEICSSPLRIFSWGIPFFACLQVGSSYRPVDMRWHVAAERADTPDTYMYSSYMYVVLASIPSALRQRRPTRESKGVHSASTLWRNCP